MNSNATDEKTIATIVPADVSAAALEMAVGMGDFSRLQPSDRLRYIAAVCHSLKLNPLTLPFRIMKLDGRDVLYATADCGSQLRSRDKISIELTSRSFDHGCVVITARATTPDGRKDEATGAVALTYPEKTTVWEGNQKRYIPHPKAGQPLEGLEFANAIKKAETQAKRRVALSLCGLGIPDESELQGTENIKVEAGSLAPGLAMPETAEDRIAKLDASLTAGEKEKAIDAEVVAEPAKPISAAAPAALDTKVSTPSPAELLPASSGAAAAPEPDPFVEPPAPSSQQTEEEKLAGDLEAVFNTDPTNCIEFCIFKGKLPKGKPLEAIDKAFGATILKSPVQFRNRVTQWAAGGKK